MTEMGLWSYYNPVKIQFGPIEEALNIELGQKVLVVTTPGFKSREGSRRLHSKLTNKDILIWDNVTPNPSIDDLDRAVLELKKEKFDYVIAIGGGSAIDAGKILSTLLADHTNPTLAEIFREKVEVAFNEKLPLLAIPTTSGTGSEVTPFATVWDHKFNNKYSMAGSYMYPSTAIIDATLTTTLDRTNTLYPALDAISHALESIWNKNRTIISQTFAIKSLELMNRALPIVLTDPVNLSIRKEIQLAATLSGIAISQTKTAIAHAASYTLTSFLGVPHGLACSVLLELLIDVFIEQNSDECLVIPLTQTKQMLGQLNLVEEFKKYKPTEHVISKLSINSERLHNSVFQLDENAIQMMIRKIIK